MDAFVYMSMCKCNPHCVNIYGGQTEVAKAAKGMVVAFIDSLKLMTRWTEGRGGGAWNSWV